jgi:hypothetical protein
VLAFLIAIFASLTGDFGQGRVQRSSAGSSRSPLYWVGERKATGKCGANPLQIRSKPPKIVFKRGNFMEPITTAIVAGTTAGAATGATDIAKKSIADSYEALKV